MLPFLREKSQTSVVNGAVRSGSARLLRLSGLGTKPTGAELAKLRLLALFGNGREAKYPHQPNHPKGGLCT